MGVRNLKMICRQTGKDSSHSNQRSSWEKGAVRGPKRERGGERGEQSSFQKASASIPNQNGKEEEKLRTNRLGGRAVTLRGTREF